jgi:F-type H+-transporting ATPase subunit b
MKSICALAWIALASPAALAAEEAPVTPFAGSLYQSAAAVIVFILLFAVLKKFAWGPILKGLQERENKIKGDLERAEEAAQQAANTLKEYQASLAQAHAEAQKVIDKGRNDAERVGAELKEQTQAEITRMKQRAEQDIRAAKEQALAELYTQTAVLATTVAGKILRREVNPQDQQRLVEESIRELGKATQN